MFTIYAWGVLITALLTIYAIHKGKQEGYSLLVDESSEGQSALALAVLLISLFWFISIPFSIYLKLTNKDN